MGNAHGYSKFASKLDDFRVYNRTLSSYEVSVLYGNGDGDFGVHTYSDFPPSFDNVPVILPPRNPVVYWTFDELNGTEVKDSSGRNNHGLWDNNISSSSDLFDYAETGRQGPGLRFDGNQTIRLTNDNGTFDIRGPFSICFWLKTSDLNAEVLASGQFNVQLLDGFLQASANVGSQLLFTEPFPVPFDEWVHVVFSWNGNKLIVYRNNEEIGIPVNASGNLTGDTTMTVGGRKYSPAGPFGE